MDGGSMVHIGAEHRGGEVVSERGLKTRGGKFPMPINGYCNFLCLHLRSSLQNTNPSAYHKRGLGVLVDRINTRAERIRGVYRAAATRRERERDNYGWCMVGRRT